MQLNQVNSYGLPWHIHFTSFSVQFGGKDLDGDDVTAETIKKQMTDQEWQKIYQMSKDKNLYQNIINSIFPTIHGEYVHKRCYFLCEIIIRGKVRKIP